MQSHLLGKVKGDIGPANATEVPLSDPAADGSPGVDVSGVNNRVKCPLIAS